MIVGLKELILNNPKNERVKLGRESMILWTLKKTNHNEQSVFDGGENR